MTRRWRWTLGIAAVVLVAIGSLYLLSRDRCFQLVGDLVCRVETERKIVALTFDDGPTPMGVDAVLPVLARYDVKATFFLIGGLMEKHPGQAERLLAAGHELGNHTLTHEQNVFRSQDFYREEVLRTREILAEAGSRTPLFRPPYGRKLLGLPMVVNEAGYTTIMWDVAERPGANPDPQDYAQDILERVRPGSIILIHPMYRANETARAALPLILEGLQARGYEVVTVSELLALRETEG